MQSVFYGVGSSVIVIIAVSAYKLTHKTIGRDWLLCAVVASVVVWLKELTKVSARARRRNVQ